MAFAASAWMAPYKKRKRVSKLKFNNFENNTCTDVIVQVFVPELPVLREGAHSPSAAKFCRTGREMGNNNI